MAHSYTLDYAHNPLHTLGNQLKQKWFYRRAIHHVQSVIFGFQLTDEDIKLFEPDQSIVDLHQISGLNRWQLRRTDVNVQSKQYSALHSASPSSSVSSKPVSQ